MQLDLCSDGEGVLFPVQINLLNRFQHEVTSYWLRYNERAVEEMITATFDLLLLGYDTPILLSPIHFLCLVDPLAQWFKMWTVRISPASCVGVHELICSCFSHLQHGQFSRQLVLKAMSERPGFVSLLHHIRCMNLTNHIAHMNLR